jgi:MOSC domain-containing protein YiiM
MHSQHLARKRFRIGTAVFEYRKPRPPCAYLETLTAQGMLKALARRSGICLRVLESGHLTVGDALELC